MISSIRCDSTRTVICREIPERGSWILGINLDGRSALTPDRRSARPQLSHSSFQERREFTNQVDKMLATGPASCAMLL